MSLCSECFDSSLACFAGSLTTAVALTAAAAGRLNLSKKTVQSHRENLKAKLRLKNATELMGYAVARHLERS